MPGFAQLIRHGVLACALLLPLGLSLATQAAGVQKPAISEAETQELASFLRTTINQATSFEDRFHAEVWLLDMSTRLQRFLPDPQERLNFLKAVHREATQAGLKPDLVLAVIEVESRFDRYAVSRVGAQGLMQVMPFWKYEIGRPDDNLTDMDTNLRYGCHILKYYLDKENGHLGRALARYNGSLGKTWYSERVLVAWKDRWFTSDL
ncbi:MAG: lytic transglycosylase domain-containing protein [Gammaproteobacteria bacterium]|nr:MAG: lytic transglycosylase domain-containing protein [Gammaproteobacteria bacterium]